MKRHTHITKIYLLIPVVILLTTACKKFVQVPPPKNTITTPAVFSDSLNATAGVIGIYTLIMDNFTSFIQGSISLYTGLASDELYPSAASSDENQFYINGVSAISNSANGVNWQNGYIIIYQANACIEGLTTSTGISNSLKNQLIGESKFLRALCYFNLVNLFGDVPLVTTTNLSVNATLPRTSKDLVYQLIIQDLKDAQNLLSTNYISAGRARANKYSALALLARCYLYLGQWQNAEDIATQVISNVSSYSLVSDLNNVFLSGSNEAILQLKPTIGGLETGDGYIFLPASSSVVPKYVISNNLLSAFELNDIRKSKWLKSNVVSSQTYYFPYKYKLGYDGNTSPTEYYMLFRLGEQYLIRAEARCNLNNVSGAQTDLNMIRARAGLPGTTATTQADVLNAIYHERQVELFCETGHRWFDLKRNGQVNSLMATITPSKGGVWSPDYQLFPIPFSQMQLNPFLNQNPGY